MQWMDIQDGFEWIQFTSYDENVVAFLRKTEKQEETILAVCNFSPVSYDSYRVGVPLRGNIRKFSTVTVKSLADRVW